MNEEEIDGGGIKREFFARALQSIGELLEGSSDHNKVFRHNLPTFNSKKYKAFGRIVAFSIIYGGPIPSYISIPIIQYLLCGHDSASCNATIDDLPNQEIKEKIIGLEQAEGTNKSLEYVFSIG